MKTIKIKWSKAGVARMYIDNSETKYKANGGGYCKASALFAEYMEDTFTPQEIANVKSYKGGTTTISYGIGMSSIQKIYEELGYQLEIIDEDKTQNIYRLTEMDK